MRTTSFFLFAIAFVGCGQVDSGRTTSLDVQVVPAPGSKDAARPGATTADNGSRLPSDKAVAADNTAVNARDADRLTRDPKLPIDQKENQADIGITAKIRQRVVGADGLSINAQNVKIITADGKVTLRGPVETEAEREMIARIAREVAGNANVDDQIDVKSSAATTSTSATTTTTNP